MKNVIEYTYQFLFEDNQKFEYKVNIDKNTFLIIPDENKINHLDWTKLNYKQCENCKLTSTQNEYCPAAISVEDIIKHFSIFASYTKVDLTVETSRITYKCKTSLQKALSSLIGICMPCSGCPILSKLRPLVKFHIPVPTSEETTYRVVSTYLFAQYLASQNKIKPDWELRHLVELYEEIKKVNNYFCERIRSVTQNDASSNAIVILNCFVDWALISITKNFLRNFEHFLSHFFNE